MTIATSYHSHTYHNLAPWDYPGRDKILSAMKTINLETEILRENTRVLAAEETTLTEQTKLDAEVNKVLEQADAAYREQLMGDLGFDYKLAEATKIKKTRQDFGHLPQARVVGLDAIKALCLKHGLRFLPTRLYKGALDAGIGAKLEEFRKLNHDQLPVSGEPELCQDGQIKGQEGKAQFYIAAPAESFALQPVPRDPLLFCRLNASKFFLLHKWGTDLDADETKKRAGQVTERNWNSSNLEMNAADYYRQFSISGGDFSNVTNVIWSGSTGTSTTFSIGT